MLASHRGYRWKFFRAGGVDQVAFRTGTDLANLEALDQKLWVALSCPVRGIDLDPKTLAIIDTDKDGRIRVGELLAAVKWAVGQLKNPDSLLAGAPDLPLSVINDQTEPGAILLTAARRVLANHGKPGAESITLADVADTRKIFDQSPPAPVFGRAAPAPPPWPAACRPGKPPWGTAAGLAHPAR